MDWSVASKAFDEKIFKDYNLFCVFINYVSPVVVCDDSDSIVNQFAKWVDGRIDMPDIGNKALADKLQSKYDKVYRSRFVSDIKFCLEEFKDCFEVQDKPRYWTVEPCREVVVEKVVKEDNTLEDLRKLGEVFSDYRRFS